MKWSKVFLLLVVVVLSSGRLIEPSEESYHACEHLDNVFAYLGIDFHHRSDRSLYFNSNSDPILDEMLENGSGFDDLAADLIKRWIEACHPQVPKENPSAWRNLTRGYYDRALTDRRVFEISKILFSNQMGSWMMEPPIVLLSKKIHNANCVEQLLDVFVKHCGQLGPHGLKNVRTFAAFCSLKVKKDELADAALQICGFDLYVQNLRR